MNRRTLSLVILVALVVATAGCGDQKAEARKYMAEGDQALAALQSDSQAFEEKQQAFQQDASSGRISTSSELDEKIAELETIASRLEAGYADAKAAYERLKTLNGVDDYARYADLRIQGLNKLTELTDTYLEFLKFISDALRQEETGQAIDQEALNNRATQISNDLMRLNEETKKLDDEAKKLKSDKKLDQS